MKTKAAFVSIVLIVVGGIVLLMTRSTTGGRVYESEQALIAAKGVPLFVCDGFELSKLDGGSTERITQVSFTGVRQFQPGDGIPQTVVYSSGYQVVASVQMLFEEGWGTRRELFQSYFPQPVLEIYATDRDGVVIDRVVVQKTHVLFKAPKEE